MANCANCGSPELEGQIFCSACGTATAKSPDGTTPLPYFPMDPPQVASSVPYAGFWWRVLGYLIDAVVLFVVVDLPLNSLHLPTAASALLRALGIFLYGTLFLTFNRGQTLGMAIAKVRVVMTPGEPVSASRAILRTLVYVLLASILTIYHVHHYAHPTPQQTKAAARQASILFSLGAPVYLDLLWMLWDKKKQTLHDKIAGTIVVRPTT
jgi:uncharacterized RDD family membrane protein YckC